MFKALRELFTYRSNILDKEILKGPKLPREANATNTLPLSRLDELKGIRIGMMERMILNTYLPHVNEWTVFYTQQPKLAAAIDRLLKEEPSGS